MQKLLLLLVIVSIFYLSNTPELRVIEPKTWVNEPEYETHVSNLTFISRGDSAFYTPYSPHDFSHPEFFLHKLGHIIFYAFFTYLLFVNLPNCRLRYMITWGVVSIFAFTDEVHQFFVVGRSGRLYDILLDSIISILTLLGIYMWHYRKKRQTEK